MIKKILFSTLVGSVACFAANHNKSIEPVKLPQYENNVFVETAFLYWIAKQEGNDYATTGSAITVPGTTDPNTSATAAGISPGNVYEPNTNIEPGFKVGLGVNLEYGKWDLFSEYTYLVSHGEGSVSSNDINSGILPLFSYTPNNSILSQTLSVASSGATGFVSDAHAHWGLHFNNITLELRRMIELFCTLSIRPHFGLQGTWQTQQFRTKYDVSSFSSFASLGHNRVQFDQSSWAVGLRFGLDTSWRCCQHLSLLLDSAVSALYGNFTAKATSYDTNIGTYSDVLIGNQTLNLYTVSPVIQVFFGLQSDWAVYSKYLLLVQAGWEEQVWFFQNQHSSTIADTSLILQGLTARIQMDF